MAVATDFWAVPDDGKCVFCQSDRDGKSSHAAGSQLKILKCLHVSCKSCAEQFLRFNNTIRCARCQAVTPDPGPGRKLTECLVSWPTQQSTVSPHSDEQDASDPSVLQPSLGEASFCQNSECEDADEPAEMHCLTCDLLLCSIHSVAHRRRKSRRDHEMIAVSLNRRSNTSDRCVLHNEDLRSYCKSCNVLMCDICQPGDLNTEHRDHEVVEIATAAKDLRDLQEEGCEPKVCRLSEGIEAVKARIDTINAETESISAKINADVAAAVKIIEGRGDELRRDLDRARWSVVKQLEEIQSCREDELRRYNAALHLSKQLDDIDALQVLSNFGRSSSTGDTDRDKCDEVQEEEKSGEKKPRDTAEDYNLSFQFEPELERGAKLLKWPSPDQATSASDKGGGVDASACQVVNFNNGAKSKSVVISKKGQVATRNLAVTRNKWYSVTARHPPVMYHVEIVSGLPFLGFASTSTAIVNSGEWQHYENKFTGWAPNAPTMGHTIGGALGQPWKEGDIIQLTLDTTAHTAIALHERTGATDTISIDNSLFPVSFRAELSSESSIRLLPKLA